MYLGNKTLCDYCSSKTMKKRHKKVDKEVQAAAAVAASSAEQQHHDGSGGSGDHNETHVEENQKSHAAEGEF